MKHVLKVVIICITTIIFVNAKDIYIKTQRESFPPDHPFGTVTPTQKIPGNLDCKGDCDDLVQGGYMKFDLSKYAQGATITQAKLVIHTLSLLHQQGYDFIYTWICNIPRDPITASPQDLHAVIEKHEDLLSSYLILSDTGSSEFNLNSRGVNAINEALSKTGNERWIPMALTFE